MMLFQVITVEAHGGESGHASGEKINVLKIPSSIPMPLYLLETVIVVILLTLIMAAIAFKVSNQESSLNLLFLYVAISVTLVLIGTAYFILLNGVL